MYSVLSLIAGVTLNSPHSGEVPFRRPQTRGQGTTGTQLSPGAMLFIEEAVHFVFRLQEGCIQVSGVEGFLDLLYGCMITTKYDIKFVKTLAVS